MLMLMLIGEEDDAHAHAHADANANAKAITWIASDQVIHLHVSIGVQPEETLGEIHQL